MSLYLFCLSTYQNFVAESFTFPYFFLARRFIPPSFGNFFCFQFWLDYYPCRKRVPLLPRKHSKRDDDRTRESGGIQSYRLVRQSKLLQTSLKRLFHGTAQSIVPLRPEVPRTELRVSSTFLTSKRPSPLAKLATNEKEMSS